MNNFDQNPDIVTTAGENYEQSTVRSDNFMTNPKKEVSQVEIKVDEFSETSNNNYPRSWMSIHKFKKNTQNHARSIEAMNSDYNESRLVHSEATSYLYDNYRKVFIQKAYGS